jgi:putative acetyltransferase
VLAGVPGVFFVALSFGGSSPRGDVRFHEAFEAKR